MIHFKTIQIKKTSSFNFFYDEINNSYYISEGMWTTRYYFLCAFKTWICEYIYKDMSKFKIKSIFIEQYEYFSR